MLTDLQMCGIIAISVLITALATNSYYIRRLRQQQNQYLEQAKVYVDRYCKNALSERDQNFRAFLHQLLSLPSLPPDIKEYLRDIYMK